MDANSNGADFGKAKIFCSCTLHCNVYQKSWTPGQLSVVSRFLARPKILGQVGSIDSLDSQCTVTVLGPSTKLILALAISLVNKS